LEHKSLEGDRLDPPHILGRRRRKKGDLSKFTEVPVTSVFHAAQFPAVSTLLACRETLCSDSSKFLDFTAGARRIAERASLDDRFRRAFWKQLRW